jgi:hypothetical protein
LHFRSRVPRNAALHIVPTTRRVYRRRCHRGRLHRGRAKTLLPRADGCGPPVFLPP